MRTLKLITSTATLFFLVLSLATPASALDRRVKIVNKTGYTIMEFYGSNTGADNWQEDILGLDVISPNTYTTIDFDDGTGYCMFDFKAVFDDGDELVRKRVNICEIGTFTYN